MDALFSLFSFLQSPSGMSMVAAASSGLFLLSEALSYIPAVRANGVFQAVHNGLRSFAERMKQP